MMNLKQSLIPLALGLSLVAGASGAQAVRAQQRSALTTCSALTIREATVTEHLTVIGKVCLLENACTNGVFARFTPAAPFFESAKACVRIYGSGETWTCSGPKWVLGVPGGNSTHVDSPELPYLPQVRFQAYGSSLSLGDAAYTVAATAP
jgi:hypothetical protein